jgi:hypothetical protein
MHETTTDAIVPVSDELLAGVVGGCTIAIADICFVD